MITRGGIKLDISEQIWEGTFSSKEEKEKAEVILQTLAGMSIASAKEMIEKCKSCLECVIINRHE